MHTLQLVAVAALVLTAACSVVAAKPNIVFIL
jgi:hypothetical protein